MEPEIRYTTTADGVSIAYYVIGDGPPLIYLSGYWNSHLSIQWASPLYRSLTESLAISSTVVRYDGRGSGLSQREPADFSLDARLLDLESVADRTGFANFSAGIRTPNNTAMIAITTSSSINVKAVRCLNLSNGLNPLGSDFTSVGYLILAQISNWVNSLCLSITMPVISASILLC